MKLKDIIVSTAVRKLVYLAIAALIGLLAMVGRAHADPPDDCTAQQTTLCTKPQAIATCLAHRREDPGAEITRVSCDYQEATGPTTGRVLHQYWLSDGSGGEIGPYNDGWWYWGLLGPDCSTLPPYGAAAVDSTDGMCVDGCAYIVELGTSNYRVVSGRTFSDQWFPSGESCTVGPDNGPKPYDPGKEVCTATGGSYSECVKPNGDHCVVAPSGANLCWSPGETGPRKTTDGKDGGDREIAPNTPTPPDIENPNQETTNTTNINGTTYNTGGYSGTGSTGGQGDTGTGGKDQGGTGDGKGNEDGVGAAAGALDGLYDGSGDTIASTVSAYVARIQSAPIMSVGTQFLSVTLTGSCPVFTLPETAYWSAMTFDYHCQGTLADALALGAYLLLAVAAYTAFKIAMY